MTPMDHELLANALTLPSAATVAREAARLLADAGFNEQERMCDISVLARAWLGWDHARWLSEKASPAPAGFVDGLLGWVARRARREPVAYITGIREFYGRPFQVTPDVLIPRPETESIIDLALEWANAHQHRPQPLRVLDLGTGSGCLAVTLALEVQDATIVAADISEAALRVARLNGAAWGLAERITFVEQSLAGTSAGAFDLIVANPPYVPEQDRSELEPDVRDFEPACALFGGLDGLDVIRALLPAAARALAADGRLLMEIGAGQADSVATLAAEAGLQWREVRPDLAGIPRVVVADAPESMP
jgi:release factor glutamine methyltransferase